MKEGSILWSIDFWKSIGQSGLMVMVLTQTYMEGCTVGEYDSFRGKLNGIYYYIFCMEEPEYVMKIMSTYYVDWLKSLGNMNQDKHTQTW